MTNDIQPSNRFQRFAHWRALTLVAACVGSGLVLDMVVLGSGPDDPAAAAVEAIAVAPVVDTPAAVPATAATVPPSTVAMPPDDSTTTVATAPVVAATASATVGDVATAAVVSPAPASAQPAPAPTPAPEPQPAPATTPATTAAPTTSAGAPPAPVLSISYPSYEMPGVAAVVLAFADESAITLWSVSPTQGWVYKVEHDGPHSVVVKFFNTQTHDEAEFQAELEGNHIKVEFADDDEVDDDEVDDDEVDDDEVDDDEEDDEIEDDEIEDDD